MTRMMRRTIRGIISGISSTASVYENAIYPSLKGSDLSRIRSDVSRVGKDFFITLKRESQQKKLKW